MARSSCSRNVVAGSSRSAQRAGVGAHLLEHDGEEVFAREAAAHLLLARQRLQRVVVVDEQELDRRVGVAGEHGADLVHVDDARVAPAVALAARSPRALQAPEFDSV